MNSTIAVALIGILLVAILIVLGYVLHMMHRGPNHAPVSSSDEPAKLSEPAAEQIQDQIQEAAREVS